MHFAFVHVQIQERQRQMEQDAAEEAKIAAECKRMADQQAGERAAEAERVNAATGGMVRRLCCN